LRITIIVDPRGLNAEASPEVVMTTPALPYPLGPTKAFTDLNLPSARRTQLERNPFGLLLAARDLP
jgi:hypothetical protein